MGMEEYRPNANKKKKNSDSCHEKKGTEMINNEKKLKKNENKPIGNTSSRVR